MSLESALTILVVTVIISAVLWAIISTFLIRTTPKCKHEWNDAGKVGYDGTRALYCPLCDKSAQVGEAAAKIMLNETMIRKLHAGKVKITPCHTVLGGKNRPNETYGLTWSYEDEKELERLHSCLKLSYRMYERMVELEKRKEDVTGRPVYRKGSRERIEFAEREAAAESERIRRIVQNEVRR